MKSFGVYKTTQEVSSSLGACVYKGSSPTAEAIIKVFDLSYFAGDKPGRLEELKKWFYRTVEMQNAAAEKSRFIAPVLLYGIDERGAWQVIKIYSFSAQKLIDSKASLTRENFAKVMEAVVQGTLDLKETCGRSHGNLKPSNVLLSGDVKSRLTEIVLSDLAPGDTVQAQKFELADLRSIGELMYQFILPGFGAEGGSLRISNDQPPAAWVKFFGNDATAWASICNRLLDPDLSLQNYNLERLALDLLKLKTATRRSPAILAASVAVLAGLVAAGVFLKGPSKQPHASAPSPTTNVGIGDPMKRQAKENVAQDQAKALVEEKRIADERAAAAAKATETEASRLAEEKRAAELKAIEAARMEVEAEAKRLAEEKKQLEQREAQARQATLGATQKLTESLEKQKEAETAGVAQQAQAAGIDGLKKSKPSRGTNWVNSLGMKFVPVGKGRILFSLWETRVADFREFARAQGRAASQNWKQPVLNQSDSDPVGNITLQEAQGFCTWLTETERARGWIDEGQFYRLPTGTEWNLACGTAETLPATRFFLWGNDWPPPVGVGNFAGTLSYDRYRFTSPAGEFQSGRAGPLDMMGNVWEICLAKSEGAESFVIKGGSFGTSSPYELNVLFPGYEWERDKYREDVGFRCVLDTGGQ